MEGAGGGVAHVPPPPPPRRQSGVRLKFPSKDIQLRGMSEGGKAGKTARCVGLLVGRTPN